MMKLEAQMCAARNFCHSPFGISSSFVIRASSFPSFVEERKHQLSFGNNCIVYDAMALGFCQTFATRFRDLGVNKNGVAGQNWFAKFYFVGAHEVADAAGSFRQLEQQDAGHLRHRFDLQDARHYRVAWEMSLKEWLVDCDRFHAYAFGFRVETDDPIDH